MARYHYEDIPLGCNDEIPDPLQYTGRTVGIIPDLDYPRPFSRALKMPIRDQGKDGKCFAFSCIKVMEIQNYFETGEMVRLSEDLFYYQKMMKSTSGMVPAWDIGKLRKIGTCLREDFNCIGEWEQIDQYIKDNNIDLQSLYEKASRFRAKTTLKLSVDELSPYLHMWKAGIISVNVHKNFYEANNDGIIPFPTGDSLGGHAMEIDEIYEKDGHMWGSGDNSWGEDWGDNGRFHIRLDNSCIKGFYGIVDANAVTSEIILEIGSNIMKTSTGDIEMDVAPFIKDNRTFVPLRAISESFGKAVDWRPLDPPNENHTGSKIVIRMRDVIKELLVV